MANRIFTVVVTVLLVAAACTSDGDGVEAGSDPTATASVAPSTVAPSTSTAPASTTTLAPLTASFRGVSADTITVGVAIIDFEELNELGFIDFTHGDKQAIYQALFDDVNDQGGINGRRIEATYETILPVGNVEGEEACIRLTEDNEVFAVIGNWVGESLLCMTDQHETIYVGHMASQSLMDRSSAVVASPDINPERRLEAMLSVLDQAGELEGETVGIITQQTMEESVRNEAVPSLEGRGADVGSVGVVTTTDDPLAAEAEVAAFV
ncbi:MAG: hypothetical protein OES57_09710, partial [Acidimicrobiia bacterium]|nr:hypothetical protein [Acidimicrobiia bacterium]